MKKRFLLFITISLIILTGSCHKGPCFIKIAVTTDVHGMIFPADLVTGIKSDHSLAQVYSYILMQDDVTDTAFFMLDNGDFLQGQPTVYYYNYIDTTGSHLSARVMNFMKYNAGTVGNHDIETGPNVYNSIREQFRFPWLAANVIYRNSGEPYFDPYTILYTGGFKIAILGLITPGIPNWLPEQLWPDMEFLDMVETAKKWVPLIEKKEKPDLLIGLFHSGTDAGYGNASPDSGYNENASLLVARNVPGFSAIFAGHDHRVSIQWIENTDGDSVLVIDPGSHAGYIGELLVKIPDDRVHPADLRARIIKTSEYPPSEAFMETFKNDYETVVQYLSDTVTFLSGELIGMDALFGPSAITSLVHSVQIEISGAEISFTAPLSLGTKLNNKTLLVSDMFNLYRFENLLYKMRLSGIEIDKFLEYAAGLWFNEMHSAADHMLLFRKDEPGKLMNPYYNFSSASGIEYTVDLKKPYGSRVEILSFSDGRPFNPDSIYNVAVNSYRGNGGGGHLTTGAGISREELRQRISWTTEKDLRYYMMQELGKTDTLKPFVYRNWKCVPDNFFRAGSERDKVLMSQ